MVGAGIGGTAAVYFLREEFGAGVKIDVFEPGTIGGRLATEKIGDNEYETGGSVIHPLNLHMKHFIEKLGKVTTRAKQDCPETNNKEGFGVDKVISGLSQGFTTVVHFLLRRHGSR